jgi:allantoin racemase
VIDDNIRRYGLDGKLGRVRASNLGVAETEDRSGHAAQKILDEARQAIAEDGCDAIILGCAGRSQLTADVRSALPVPVHDGVEAALRLALAIADQTPVA